MKIYYFNFLTFSLLLTSCTNFKTTTGNLQFFKATQALTQPIDEKHDKPFTYHLEYKLKQFQEGESPKIRKGHLTYSRISEQEFSVAFKYKYFSMELTRNKDKLFMYIPHSETLFTDDNIGPTSDSNFTLENVLKTALAMEPKLKNCFDFIQETQRGKLENKFTSLGLKLKRLKDSTFFENYQITKQDQPLLSCKVHRGNGRLSEVTLFSGKSSLTIDIELTDKAQLIEYPGSYDIEEHLKIKKHELHRSFTRGLARLAEIKFREAQVQEKENFVKKGPYGYYRMKEGQRLVKLKGNSYQIGWQHGKFLPQEIRRTVDSTLYLVGLVYSVKKGRWFFDEMRGALKRLDKFTPPEYLEEMKGVAEGSGLDYESVHLANYFPALFHCSGFALKDSATADGTLYHGRILDYMSGVGLQNSAVVFAVEKEGKIPFVNIGYASFVGCVSGMNQQKISLGEMGGRGEGNWDGITMPLLMRMSLENGHNLEEVKKIFSSNPRTCEYYYVFTDGKDKSAVGVYALPERIEFIQYGQKHERLKHSFKNCILMSSGERYDSLSEQVRNAYSSINEEAAIQLMNSPVAMESNLHSVLFMPETLTFRVANASPLGPAFKNPFYTYTLDELIDNDWYK
jgi:hypothetical protein